MSGSNSSDPAAAALERSKAHPLGLTVHGLPPVQDAVRAAQAGRNARWKLLALLLVCASPVIAPISPTTCCAQRDGAISAR